MSIKIVGGKLDCRFLIIPDCGAQRLPFRLGRLCFCRRRLLHFNHGRLCCSKLVGKSGQDKPPATKANNNQRDGDNDEREATFGEAAHSTGRRWRRKRCRRR